MVSEGADIIDVGGESTRPSLYGEVVDVSVAEERNRVIPVIEGIRRHGDVPISVDTAKAEVAAAALDAGADIINDISCLDDSRMAGVAVRSEAHLILMHRRGTPATMQRNTHYDDLLGEISTFLAAGIARACAAGVDAGRVAVDPGLGFGKSLGDNLALLRRLKSFAALRCPVVVGASRKSFVWKPAGLTPKEALPGSLAAAVLAAVHGAHMVRVHDVAETVRAVRFAEAVESAEPSIA
jgi:dihydropteroate synthase